MPRRAGITGHRLDSRIGFLASLFFAKEGFFVNSAPGLWDGH